MSIPVKFLNHTLETRNQHLQISTAFLDSGIDLNTSQDYNDLHSAIKEICASSPTAFGESQSCPVTPRHSVTIKAAPVCPRPFSARSYAAKYPTSYSEARHAKSTARSRSSTQVLRLPTLYEADIRTSPGTTLKFQNLNAELDETLRELEKHSLNGTATPVGATPVRNRRMSDVFTSMKKMPKMQTLKKCFSTDDIRVETELYVQSSDKTGKEETKVTNHPDAASDEDWECVSEDLTRHELICTAQELHPDKGFMLSALLHNKTHVWDGLTLTHPHMPSEEKILRVLEKWFENVSPSHENRRTLANACKRVSQQRVAYKIAKKLYACK